MCEKLNKLRNKIDDIDKKILDEFLKRYNILKDIKEFKCENNISIKDKKREKEHLDSLIKKINDKDLKKYLLENFKDIFSNSYWVYKKNLIALIGKNIEKSPSPKLHNLICKYLNLDYDFIKIQSDNIDYDEYIISLKNGKYMALFITMPYKEKFINYVDYLSIDAFKSGVVNYIYYDGKNIIGDNSDTKGFLHDFKDISVGKDYVPFIMGDGATSKSVALALDKLGFKKPIFVSKFPRGYNKIDYLMFSYIMPRIVINTTPVGIYGDSTTLIKKDSLSECIYFYDCINEPLITSHLRLVKNGKNGLGMLIYQGLYAIREIFGIDFDIDDIFKKIYEEMKND